MTDYLSIDWTRYHTHAQSLAEKILSRPERFDEIVAIARGGLVIGRLLSDFLQLPISSITIQSYTDIQEQGEVKITAKLVTPIKNKRVLLVDDLTDSGKTLHRATEYLKELQPASITTAVLYMKPKSTFRPDFFVEETDRWILFPFEVTEWVTTFTKKMKGEGKSPEEINAFLLSLGYTKSQMNFTKKYFS